MMNDKAEWETYLGSFMKAYNGLPELPSLLNGIATPILFQYVITDQPEMSFWQIFEKDQMRWGMGESKETGIPKVVHKTNFETIKKVNSGESDPVQATMDGTYTVEGDLPKLMACAPLIPLNAKAHSAVEATGKKELESKDSKIKQDQTESSSVEITLDGTRINPREFGGMKFILQGRYNFELLNKIRNENLPVTHYIIYVPDSPFGSGSIFLPEELPTWKEFEKFVAHVKSLGIVPIAQLDSTCQGNFDAHVEQYKATVSILEKLQAMGIYDFFVSAPLNIKFVKSRISDANIILSYSQMPTSTNRVKIYFDIGADAVVLHPDIGRNLSRLENLLALPSKMDTNRELTLVLPLNSGCNWGCFLWYHHHNIQSHRTMNSPVLPNQKEISGVANEGDYSLLHCWKKRLEQPSAILQAGWIPPSDLDRYEKLGYEHFLLFTEGMNTQQIVSTMKSYKTNTLSTKFNEILRIPHPYGDYWQKDLAEKALLQLKPAVVEDFCKNYPYDESYPSERNIDPYCRTYAEKFPKGDEDAKLQLLSIINEKLELIQKGAIER